MLKVALAAGSSGTFLLPCGLRQDHEAGPEGDVGWVPHGLCLSTEAFVWVRFHETRGRGSVLAPAVCEDQSGSAWPLSQNGAWMLNCVPSADAKQMTEQIKGVPACPQPESTVCGWRTSWPGGEA